MPHSSSIFFFSSTSSSTVIAPSCSKTVSTAAIVMPPRFLIRIRFLSRSRAVGRGRPRLFGSAPPRPLRRLGSASASGSAPARPPPRARPLPRLGSPLPRLRLGGRLGLRWRPVGRGVGPPSCSMRASISPTRFWSGALTRARAGSAAAPTIAPSTCPRSTSNGGSFASSSTSSPEIVLPCISPPRISSTFVSLAESASAFATATMSPSLSMNAIAEGPSSSASSASAPAASAARRVSVFLTTVNFAPCSISFPRRASICGIVRPR